jgi:prevent-host-death family protein
MTQGSQAKTQSARRWRLQDAKARLSELVRRAKTEGPQHVTLHGRDAVVVISSEEFRRLSKDQTGQALIDVLQEAALADVDLERVRVSSSVRDVVL